VTAAHALVGAVAAAQIALALRVLARLVRTARGVRIEAVAGSPCTTVAVLVPVLDEAGRLGPCLDGLSAQGPVVTAIIVADGGSRDGTPAVVARHAGRDPRVRLVTSGPAPAGWTGKIWNLMHALAAVPEDVAWVLGIDADVRPRPGLVAALTAHAERVGVAALSVATRQTLAGAGDALVHPACLTTLVYRFGVPGHATGDAGAVQANGQCFLARRADLVRTDAFGAARASLCEDVTIARALAAAGIRVGFYEADGLVRAAMYASGGATWRNWPRSLPMRDQWFGVRGWLGLAEVVLVQALPLALLVAALALAWPIWLVAVEAMLVAVRIGVLAGTARAYEQRPWAYWLSPLADLPVAARVVASALQRRHSWRGRRYERVGGGRFRLVTDEQGGMS
jgi:dolichol-phosphate mannosyltransferase